MGDNRDSLVEEIFQEAADLPADRRGEFLEQRCGTDRTLRDEVEVLLRHDEEGSPAFLAGPVSTQPPGTVIGEYHLLDLIGEGAFGEVYRAEQSKPVRRQVALKIIKLGMDTREVVARFEAERQAMAMMDHANIARVFDAGATDTGRPFFVMEHVPGVPLNRFCDEQRFDTEQRLEIFRQVCEAIQHAHQKGIIHRDLKPSNILVTLDGDHAVPKVIDFGIAKAIGCSLTDRTLATASGQLLGTPEYMSPEQADLSATDIDTRTDIYSLGVVLYELLVGAGPFDPGSLRSGTIADIQQRIREQQPPPPSTRLSRIGADAVDLARRRQLDPSGLRRRLMGDLDWITMKAMEKERSRRYASASEFAADIERHLNDEPVMAGPPSAVYRVGKFVRRNRALVAGVMVAFVALALGVGVASWQAVRAAAEARRAIVIKDFLATTIGAADFIEAGRRLKVADVLDEASAGLDDFEGEPEIEAEIRHLLGLAYYASSEFVQSLWHLRTALAIRRRVLGKNHPDTLETAHRLGDILESIWQNGEARRILEEVVEARRRTLGPDHPDTLWSMARLARTLSSLYRLDESAALAGAAAAGLAATVGEGDPRTIRARDTLSTAMGRAGRRSEADEMRQKNLEAARRWLGSEHRLTLWLQREWGFRLHQLDRWSKAEPLLRSALATQRRLFGEDDYRAMYFTWTLGYALAGRGEMEEGRRLIDEGIDGLRRAFGERHLYTAYAIGCRSEVERMNGELANAEGSRRLALGILREWLDDDHPHVLDAQTLLAQILCLTDRCDEAETLLLATAERYREINVTPPIMRAGTLARLAAILAEQGRLMEAETLTRERLEVLQNGVGGDHGNTLWAALDLARLLARLDRPDEAEKYYLLVVDGSARTLGEDSRTTLNVRNEAALAELVDLYDARGQPEKAAQYRALLLGARSPVGE